MPLNAAAHCRARIDVLKGGIGDICSQSLGHPARRVRCPYPDVHSRLRGDDQHGGPGACDSHSRHAAHRGLGNRHWCVGECVSAGDARRTPYVGGRGPRHSRRRPRQTGNSYRTDHRGCRQLRRRPPATLRRHRRVVHVSSRARCRSQAPGLSTTSQALDPHGVFITVDCCPPADPQLAAKGHTAWRDHLKQSYADDEADGYLAAWAKEDVYFSLPHELEMLTAAGFSSEVVWRRELFAVVAARPS